jgi:hypothetical protein
MNTRQRLVLAAVLLGCTSLSARASVSSASDVSGSVSTSVGTLSGSISRSSDSSKGKEVAEGDYRVIEVAAADTLGRQRVKLQATTDATADGELYLTLPPVAVARGELAPGAVVTAKARPYGTAFIAAATRQAFFLAMNDDWYRELDSRALSL